MTTWDTYRRALGKTCSTKTYPTRREAMQAAARSVKGKPVSEWPYHDGDGNERLVVIRFDTANGKGYRPIHKNEHGWCLGDPPEPLPLYCLPEILSRSNATIYVCEGERAADAARSIGLTTTTSAHGALAPKQTDWTPLAGRDVVVLPDNDGPGGEYARSVAAILLRLNPPATVRILPLPDLPESGDIVEFIETHKHEKGAEHG